MKEPNNDGPMECEGCGKVCQGIQGIRGHRRSCPGRKPVAVNQVHEPQEPVVEPGYPAVRAPNQQLTIGSRLEVEGSERVIRIHEPVRALREQLVESLPIRQLMDAVARSQKWPTFDDWYALGRDVAHIELATERMLQQTRVSRDEPWTLHQLAPTQNDGRDEGPTGDDLADILTDFGIPELEAAWNQVIEGLRWLTAHTRATL